MSKSCSSLDEKREKVFVHNSSRDILPFSLNSVFFNLANMGTTTGFNDASIIDDIWMEVLLSDPLTQINGLTVIADCKGMSSAILKWLIPKNCKVGAAKLEALPVKNWTVHVVNMGPIMRACVMIIKPFLKKSTVARVSWCYFLLNRELVTF